VLKLIKKSKFSRKSCFAVYKSIKDVTEKSNLIFSSNLLEHIKDDQSKLYEIFSHIKKWLYISFLPAQQILFNSFDISIGHYRRYEISDIRIKCKMQVLKL
jgi:hypothetical protein